MSILEKYRKGHVPKDSELGSYSRLYQIWAGIKTRCCNPNSSNYKNYGARGITMCDEWRDYPAFEKWALSNGYKPSEEKKHLYIERLNNDGNYEPANCIWTSAKAQMNNTRRNVYLEYKGMKKTLSQWAECFGIGYSTFMTRYERGWSLERIENTPVRRCGKR